MLKTNQAHQNALDQLLKMRYPAIAVKLCAREEDVPAGAEYPMRDWGKHIALCQAFAYARRQGKTLCLRKEDHWCWTPLSSYGMTDASRGTVAFDTMVKTIGTPDPEKAAHFIETYLPELPQGSCFGIVVAPLDKAEFDPDLILTYTSNGQLRLMLMAVFSQTGLLVDSSFMPLESCIYSVIPPIREGNYRITLPDPGEYERALTPDDEIIFSIPAQRSEEFFTGVARLLEVGHDVNSFYQIMEPDFPRPPFYNKVFESWGLGTGELWDKQGVTVSGEKAQ